MVTPRYRADARSQQRHWFVDADTTVLFIAAPSVASIGGRPVNLYDVRWYWVSITNPSQTASCTSGSTTCTQKMASSGTMVVTAYVNGAFKQAALSIKVTGTPGVPKPCKEIPVMRDSFPEIANDKMDSVLKKLWLESKYSPDSTNAQRREVGGFIVLQDGNYHFVEFDNTKGGPCWHPYEEPPVGVGTIISAEPVRRMATSASWTFTSASTGRI